MKNSSIAICSFNIEMTYFYIAFSNMLNTLLELEELMQSDTLVAQLVNNPLAMLETWVRSLGWEDPLEKGKATHSSILA